MFDLSGKTALVTGASGGIGRAIAEALHASGANVAVTGRRQEALAEIVSSLGPRAVAVGCDLSDPKAIDVLIKESETKSGGAIDILVNNAGATRDNLFIRMKDEEWDEILAVDLTAAFRLSRAVLRGMMRKRFGRIISITSVVGTIGNAGQANYAAAKAGLAGMSRSLAAEVASRNITVNCVAPGFIATPMTDVLGEDQKKGLFERIPAGRFGTPADIAATVVFLASNEASYLTGQTIHVNGGMAMI